MIIKRLLFSVWLLAMSHVVSSQSFEWIRSVPVGYQLNPTYPEFPVHFDAVNQRVVHARIDTVAMIYGTSVLGTTFVESRDTNGQVLWQFQLGDLASVQRVVTDPSGNIYVAGLFQQTLYIGANDSLTFITGTFVFQNTFIIKLDMQGNLLWKRNVTASWPDYEGIESLAIDPSGNCWFTMTDFMQATIVEMDAGGTDLSNRHIENGKRIGNISFDPWGGMFVSGAAGLGNFIMDADTFVATSDYNMFIARFDPNGNPSWAYFGHDVTFQRPMVVADAFGNAFMAGNRYDTTSFNGTFFFDPYLSSDFFAFMIDTSGAISWGLQQPPLGIGPYGTFEIGSNLMVAADASGKYYLGGTQRGTVDWGGNYISSTPSLMDRKIAVACINPAGLVQWVKWGGSDYNNYLHALTVSNGGACYFTGSFRDTAVFDTITIQTTTEYNFVLGKINPALPSGLEENVDAELQLYPNPANEFIFLPGELLSSRVQLYDVTGKLVYDNPDITEQQLSTRYFEPGVYSLVFKNAKTVKYSKIIIVH